MKRGELLSKAILLATQAHFGAFDKGGKPYILHSIAVMNKVRLDDEELMCIAILHDVVEDTDVTWNDLQQAGMTSRIIEGVKGLTKMTGQTYQEYQESVFASKDCMMVKLADLEHNMDPARIKGVTEKDIQRMTKYQKFYWEIKQKLTED